MSDGVIYKVENNLNPAPYSIEVRRDGELDQYTITLSILEKRFSRIEKTRVRAVIYAKEMNQNLEDAFKYTFEDNT